MRERMIASRPFPMMGLSDLPMHRCTDSPEYVRGLPAAGFGDTYRPRHSGRIAWDEDRTFVGRPIEEQEFLVNE